MVNSCYLNPLVCKNNGTCIIDTWSNATYCQCGPCHTGTWCQWDSERKARDYVFLIAYIVQFCLSFINNSLVLELLICCSRIRKSNCGIYLMIYSMLSFVSSILLLVSQVGIYYEDMQILLGDQYDLFRCYTDRVGNTAVVGLCLLLSSCIALERGIIICLKCRMNATRWRSYVVIIVLFAIVIACTTPMLVHQCNWHLSSDLETVRVFLTNFFPTTSITVYVLATVLVFISCVHRIRRYSTEADCYIKTFAKLTYAHLFIFVPPLAYAICYIPFTIVYHIKDVNQPYLPCSISTLEFVLKILAEAVENVPYSLTWLLFVYPSRVYMNEFYLHTWSGQHVAQLLLFFKSYNF